MTYQCLKMFPGIFIEDLYRVAAHIKGAQIQSIFVDLKA